MEWQTIGSQETLFDSILEEAQQILSGSEDRDTKLYKICGLLQQQVAHYHWVGFYLVDPHEEDELVLGPFVGAPTEHTRIGFGEGICGQAAEQEETFVVQDVSQETNYLSCSIDVKSEIVVPLMTNGTVVGELDIDSHNLAPFTSVDRRYLEKLCSMVAEEF